VEQPGDQIRSWIVFGMGPDGKYEPAVDPAQVEGYLSGISGAANVPATAPSVLFDAGGKPKTLRTGNNGVGIDLGATTDSIASYLDALATGGKTQDGIEVSVATISPAIKPVDVTKFVIIGSQTITFFPGAANGNGNNIRVPARNLNGRAMILGIVPIQPTGSPRLLEQITVRLRLARVAQRARSP